MGLLKFTICEHCTILGKVYMHVISRKPFMDAMETYPVHAKAILQTYLLLTKVQCETPEQLRLFFKSLDNFKHKAKWYVIDISGNSLRLLAFIEFRGKKVFIKHIVNHAEYDKLCQKYAKGA